MDEIDRENWETRREREEKNRQEAAGRTLATGIIGAAIMIALQIIIELTGGAPW